MADNSAADLWGNAKSALSLPKRDRAAAPAARRGRGHGQGRRRHPRDLHDRPGDLDGGRGGSRVRARGGARPRGRRPRRPPRPQAPPARHDHAADRLRRAADAARGHRHALAVGRDAHRARVGLHLGEAERQRQVVLLRALAVPELAGAELRQQRRVAGQDAEVAVRAGDFDLVDLLVDQRTVSRDDLEVHGGRKRHDSDSYAACRFLKRSTTSSMEPSGRSQKWLLRSYSRALLSKT